MRLSLLPTEWMGKEGASLVGPDIRSDEKPCLSRLTRPAALEGAWEGTCRSWSRHQ
jgi:hypothetical protein